MTRMLVVEDDAVARDLLCEILRGEGFEVEAVDDGGPAVERAGDGRYDLVLSDVRMERVGGLDVLRAFTEKSPTTPVILITAFGDVTGAMEAIGHGAYGGACARASTPFCRGGRGLVCRECDE
jgi:DNA-binding NtrC family response regulator